MRSGQGVADLQDLELDAEEPDIGDGVLVQPFQGSGYLKGALGDGTSGPLTSATGTEPGAASRYIRNVSGGPGR